jgi:hypothetical protein
VQKTLIGFDSYALGEAYPMLSDPSVEECLRWT